MKTTPGVVQANVELFVLLRMINLDVDNSLEPIYTLGT
jgi:hypothetical protein